MSKRANPEDFWKRVDVRSPGDCWEWKGNKHRQGYGRPTFRGAQWLAHRLAWFLTHGSIDANLDLLHKCDNPPCVNPSHLIPGTHAENMKDASRKRRLAIGERARNVKLKEIDVREIRRAYAAGEASTGELASRYGIARSGVVRIIHFKLWKHVTASKSSGEMADAG